MPRRRLLLASAIAWPLAATAQRPLEPGGVRYPASVEVAGTRLQLNGAGVRYKVVVRVYAAGLYLQAPADTPEAVISAPGPKRLHVVMLRDIDGKELGRLFTRGLQDNAPREALGATIAGTLRMAELFAAKKRLAAGEHFSVDWVPGHGTLLRVNGQAQGEAIREPEFFAALLRIWLGPSPADAGLKAALLGLPPAPQAMP